MSILSGKMGGMPWEALSGTIGRFDGPIRKPVEIQIAGERSRVRVPGAIELSLKPLTDPITGQEKEVHIVYLNITDEELRKAMTGVWERRRQLRAVGQ